MKPVLIIQLRPEDKAAESEFAAILRTARLNRSDVERLRGEAVPFGDLNLAKYSAIIVGGSPFDVTTPEDKKSDTQKRIEDDFMSYGSEQEQPKKAASSGVLSKLIQFLLVVVLLGVVGFMGLFGYRYLQQNKTGDNNFQKPLG